MNKIIVPSTSIMITEACTLKCKLCLAYVPYYKEYQTMTTEEAQRVLEQYFSIVDEVEKLSITGGEPLIHPQLNEIISIILGYAERVTKEIILITNGTISFSEKILDVLEENSKVKVIVNHYGVLSPHAEENYKKLCDRGIRSILYTEDNRYSWIDCRDHSLKHKTKEEIEKQAEACAFFQGKKYVIDRGCLYTCTRACYRIQNDLIPYTSDAYIDLLGEETVSEQRDKLRKLLNSKSMISCAYCDGLTEKSKKYRAAEQLGEK